MGMFDFLASEPRAATWDEVERKRALADALAMGVGSPSTFGEGIASLGSALGGVLAGRKADKMDVGRAAMAEEIMADALGGIPQDRSGLAAALAPSVPTASSVLGGVDNSPVTASPLLDATGPQFENNGSIARDSFVQGLVKRGLPQHVAEGFAINGHDESRLNPGINEAAPIVPGSRGGFGLMQWTGPRRRGLEQFAASSGRNVADPELQMDYLMSELQGSERAAAQAIMSAPDSGSAAAAIVNKFLRPAEQHRASREARYLSGSTGEPMAATPAAYAPYQPPPVNVAMMRAMNNPYLSPDQRATLQAIQAQQQANQMTPYQAAQLQMAQQEHDLRMAQAATPEAMRGVVVNGRLVNPQTGQVMADFSQQQAAEFRPAKPEEAAQYGAPAGQFGPDGRFYPVNPPSGFSIETGPDGQMRVTQGAGVGGGKPLTESEGRNTGFLIRAQESNTILDRLGDQGTNLGQRMAAGIPVLGNYALSDEYQQFDQAKRDFVNAILRRESGAVISPQEFDNADKQYFPQPGDSDVVKAQKAKNRIAALDGLRVGSGRGAEMAKPPEPTSDDDLLKKYGG